jgi:hypothetical protein
VVRREHGRAGGGLVLLLVLVHEERLLHHLLLLLRRRRLLHPLLHGDRSPARLPGPGEGRSIIRGSGLVGLIQPKRKKGIEVENKRKGEEPKKRRRKK